MYPLLLAAMFGPYFFLGGDHDWEMIVSVAVVVILYLVVLTIVERRPPEIKQALAEGRQDGLYIDGKLYLPRKNILAAGLSSPPEGRPYLGVIGKHWLPEWTVFAANQPADVTLQLEKDADAETILHAMDMSLSQRTNDFTIYRIRNTLQALLPIPVLFVVASVFLVTFTQLSLNPRFDTNPYMRGFLFGLGMMLTLSTFVLGYFSSAVLIAKTHIVVGLDGVLFETRFQKRFIPYSQIKTVKNWSKASTLEYWLELDLTNGEKVQLTRCVGRPGGADPSKPGGLTMGDPRTELLAAKIQSALLDYHLRPKELPGDLFLSLALGERNIAEWLSDLKKLGESDYRTAPANIEQLFSIVENPVHSPDLRIGAAIVLSTQSSTERERVAKAAQTVANETAREILLSIANGEQTLDTTAQSKLQMLLTPEEDSPEHIANRLLEKRKREKRLLF